MPWYIDMATQTVTDTEPDLTGRTKVNIAVPEDTNLDKINLHLDAVRRILANPFTSIGLVVFEIDLDATWYIDLASKTVSSTQPDITGRTEVPFPVQNGTVLSSAITQLEALTQVINSPMPTAANLVVKVIVGSR